MVRMFFAAVAALIATMTMTMPAFAQRTVERGFVHEHREEHVRVRVRQDGPRMQVGRQYDAISFGHRGLIAVNFSYGGGGRRQVRYEPVTEVPRGGCRVNIDSGMPPEVQEVEVPRAIERVCYRRARAGGYPLPRIYYNYY